MQWCRRPSKRVGGASRRLLLSLAALAVLPLTGQTTFAAEFGKENLQTAELPNRVGATPGWVFEIITTEEHNAFIEQTHTPVIYNATSTTSPYQFQQTVNFTVTATHSGNLAAGWGPINAAVGFDASQSLTCEWSQALTVNIPPHQYGWIDFGYARDKWYGDYAYQDSYGNLSNDEYITVTSPRCQMWVARTAGTAPDNP